MLLFHSCFEVFSPSQTFLNEFCAIFWLQFDFAALFALSMAFKRHFSNFPAFPLNFIGFRASLSSQKPPKNLSPAIFHFASLSSTHKHFLLNSSQGRARCVAHFNQIKQFHCELSCKTLPQRWKLGPVSNRTFTRDKWDRQCVGNGWETEKWPRKEAPKWGDGKLLEIPENQEN